MSYSTQGSATTQDSPAQVSRGQTLRALGTAWWVCSLIRLVGTGPLGLPGSRSPYRWRKGLLGYIWPWHSVMQRGWLKLEIKDGMWYLHSFMVSKQKKCGGLRKQCFNLRWIFKNLNHILFIKPVKGTGRASFSGFVTVEFLLGLRGQPTTASSRVTRNLRCHQCAQRRLLKSCPGCQVTKTEHSSLSRAFLPWPLTKLEPPPVCHPSLFLSKGACSSRP